MVRFPRPMSAQAAGKNGGSCAFPTANNACGPGRSTTADLSDSPGQKCPVLRFTAAVKRTPTGQFRFCASGRTRPWFTRAPALPSPKRAPHLPPCNTLRPIGPRLPTGLRTTRPRPRSTSAGGARAPSSRQRVSRRSQHRRPRTPTDLSTSLRSRGVARLSSTRWRPRRSEPGCSHASPSPAAAQVLTETPAFTGGRVLRRSPWGSRAGLRSYVQ